MDDLAEQVAALAALSHWRELFVKSCEEPDMMDILEELRVITIKEKEEADYNSAYDCVAVKFEERIRQDSQIFTEFCTKVLEKEELKDLAESLLARYNEEITGSDENEEAEVKTSIDKSQGQVKLKIDQMAEKLQKQLKTLHEITDSEDMHASKQNLIQTAVMKFISTSLDAGISAHDICESLDDIYSKQLLLDNDTFRWSIDETEKQNKVRNPQATSPIRGGKQQLNELFFDKVVVQNSLIACYMLAKHKQDTVTKNVQFCHSICKVDISESLTLLPKEKKPKMFSLLESQMELDTITSAGDSNSIPPASKASADPITHCSRLMPVETGPVATTTSIESISLPVHRYLIAKQEKKKGDFESHSIYYIAFSSHEDLAQWKDNHSSFEEGFQKQKEQLPLQFILERLWEGDSVVLTGFSFGSILAHMCASHLWGLSQEISSELLEKHLLCITYGRPLIQVPEARKISDQVPNDRFHAIYFVSDVVPRMMRYLDISYTTYAVNQMPERFLQPMDPDKVFQDQLSTSIMGSLIPLQKAVGKHSKLQKMRYKVEKKISKGSEKISTVKTEVKNVLLGVPREPIRHCDSESVEPLTSTLDAMSNLHSLIGQPHMRQRFRCLPLYVRCYEIGARGLHEIDHKGDYFGFLEPDEIKEDMFHLHNTESYLEAIVNQYVNHPPIIDFPQHELCHFVKKPEVNKIEIHHFSHRNTASISIDGDYLCFVSHIDIQMDSGEYKFDISHQEPVSSQSIQLLEKQINLPPKLKLDNCYLQSICQECEEQAVVHLKTHFGSSGSKHHTVKVTHKKFAVSCRKQQVAKLSPAEIIELSFLSALLEQHPDDSHSISKRFQTIKKFFEAIEEVVPIESLLSSIATTSIDKDVHRLSLTLKESDLRPPFSLSLFINTALAINKLQGKTLNPSVNEQTLYLEDLFYVFVLAAKRRAATRHHLVSLVKETKSLPEVEGIYMKSYLKWFPPSISSKSQNAVLVYFRTMVEDAIKSCTGRITAISGVCIKSLFETIEERCMTQGIKSAITLLKEGRDQLQNFQVEMRQALRRQTIGSQESCQPGISSTRAHNAKLLEYVNKLRGNDLRIVIQILLSFMEERVRIPISESKSVSYWKLMKLGLGIFRRKISHKGITQYVSVSKHVRSIADEDTIKSKDMSTNVGDNSEELYAGKLQFLSSAIQESNESSLIDPEYPIFSLENQIVEHCQCKDRNISNNTPVQEIWMKWEKNFKDVSMGEVVQSHRSLIATWLKFSLMIHKLREELSSNTSVGVVGLVNSGKSTLVQQLFKIKIETGTREEKRTTVPFLYNIQGVGNFNVIDFPGVDDQDDSITDLVNLLRRLSQLVIFVVNYRNAHTQAAVEWYRKLNEYAIPHLVCLSHGDRLYAECREDEELYRDPTYSLRAIKKQVETVRNKIIERASDSPVRTVGIFSLRVDFDSDLNSEDGKKRIHDAGVKNVSDVGLWITDSLHKHFKEDMLAKQLKQHFGMYTIGIVGLVNSGKSTFIKKFSMEVKEKGLPREMEPEKNTIVPITYKFHNLDGLTLLEYPGVDDSSVVSEDLEDAVYSQSQLVVFITNYRHAHTKEAVNWYRKLNRSKLPHLICLTHGDGLLDESKCTDIDDEELEAKAAIRKQIKIITDKVFEQAAQSQFCSMGIFSLRDVSDQGKQKIIQSAGVLSIKDVGRWITETLHVQFKEVKIAKTLKEHFEMYTVGIIGLQKSGKQTLIHQLFRVSSSKRLDRYLEQEQKHLATPVRYNIQDVESFDVIKFPSVDHDSTHIEEFLGTLSQLVIFVVNYRYANKPSALEWYQKLSELNIPHLVCWTHGDQLIDEMGSSTQAVKEALKKRMHSMSKLCTMEIYNLSENEPKGLYDAGVLRIKDVGKWIIESLTKHYNECKVTKELQQHFTL